MLSASKSLASSRASMTKRSPSQFTSTFRNSYSSKKFYSTEQQQGQQGGEGAKKPFSFTRFIFKLGFLTAGIYGTAATAALIYEPLQDPYIEYFPYGEKVMDNIDYTWKHRQEIINFDYSNYYQNKYTQFADSINNTASKLGLENYINIQHKGFEATPITDSTKIELNNQQEKKNIQSEKDSKFIVLSNSDSTIPQLNKIILPLISIKSDDSNINSLVSNLNHLITEFNNSKTNENSAKLIIDKINSNLSSLSNIFNKKEKTSNLDSNLNSNLILNEKLDSIKQKFEQEKTILISKLTKTAEKTKLDLELKHKEILIKEISEIQKTMKLQYDNKLKKSELDLIEKFDQTVTSKIESERNNKLKDLENLSKRIDKIEEFELQLSKVATSYTTFKEVRKSISKIRELLNSNISSNIRGENLVNEINNLKLLTKPLNNELINVTIDSLPSNKEFLINGGVLTQSQILTRWELLAPELRSVSLLPENPGILGYASSKFFSKFLWSKSGVPIKNVGSENEILGNDVESVISRVNNYLQKNQIDNAVEEVTQLKGVARELANDWLVDTRRKLEVQFLVDLLSTEVNISA